MRDVLVIVNEHAGGGAMADTFRRLEHPLFDLLGAFDLAFTDGPGHAITLTRQALAAGGRRLIIAGGGDGTLNEVVNGFFAEDGTPLGRGTKLALLAGGTGGDFRKTVRVNGPDATLAALRGGRSLVIDVGRVVAQASAAGGELRRHFVNIASFGLSGRVDQLIPSFKAFGGAIGYLGATLKALWSWKNPRVSLTLDGEALAPQPIFTVAVANGRYFGGGMMVAPDARLDSGHFDVTVLGDLGKLEMMLMSRTIYSGEHVYHPKVTTRRAKVVEARPEPGPDGVLPEVLLDIDGEPIGVLPARVEIVPAGLELVVP
jgi:YegS/Rv2252/BmrU family lipid kinase